jgi:hypothetical protein
MNFSKVFGPSKETIGKISGETEFHKYKTASKKKKPDFAEAMRKSAEGLKIVRKLATKDKK